MTRLSRITALGLAITAFLPSAAFAHTGIGGTSGFIHGFVHPVSGLDHVLAMLAVGILAARLGGRAIWLVPLAFVTMMIVGGMAGVSGVPLPFVELGNTGSIIVLGFVIALGSQLSVPVATALVGFLAIFHGHAHGTEMPIDLAGISYGAGFATATALLHIAGLALGFGAYWMASTWSDRASRIAGGAVAVTGLGLMAGLI